MIISSVSSKFIQISMVFGSNQDTHWYTPSLELRDCNVTCREPYARATQICSRGQNKGFGLVPEKKAAKETRQKHCCLIVFVCLVCWCQHRIESRTESLSHQPLSFCFCFWGGWLCGGKSLTPAPISGHIGHRIDMDRWVPEVVMRTTSDPTPRWRSDETRMIKMY